MKFNDTRILVNPRREWKSFLSKVEKNLRFAARKIDVDWETYNEKDFLFTHDSIVASVAVEDDGFTIKKPCWELVNANGNAWTNDVLLHCYKTFVGGENYSEHIQVPSLSNGKILDAVIREVMHKGEKIYVVDILVATSRKKEALVARIESGDLNTMSMGASAKYVQCSVCGKIFNMEDETPEHPLHTCEHLEKHLGETVTYNGKEKICAELCGAMDPKTKEYIPDSCVFIEASWVDGPAFKGAVLNYFVETPEMTVVRNDKQAMITMFTKDLLSTLRVADKTGAVALSLLKEMNNF